jgi:glutathione S-transferase
MTQSSRPVLLSIGPSHYCEKVRWALKLANIEYTERVHAPFMHIADVKRMGGVRTTPVLVTSEATFSDSTDILGWIQRNSHSDWTPYGSNDADKKAIEEWEEKFDEVLGPHSRRFAYFHLLPNGPLSRKVLCHRAPLLEARFFPLIWPAVRLIMKKLMRIDSKGAQLSKQKIESVFIDVQETLEEKRANGVSQPFLCGNSISAADITFAALAAPILLPAQYGALLPTPDELSSELNHEIQLWREHPAGKFALKLYREERT